MIYDTLQARKRALTRNQICQHFDLKLCGLQKWEIVLFKQSSLCILCYSGLNRFNGMNWKPETNWKFKYLFLFFWVWNSSFTSIELFFFFNFIFKLYNIVLVLPNIEMNPPQVYLCSPSWTLFPPPSPYPPSGLSQCTRPKHPVSCIEPGLATHFIHGIIHGSMTFSQISPPSPSPTESIRLFYTSVSLLLSRTQGYCYHLSKFHIYALVYCIGVFLSGLLHCV